MIDRNLLSRVRASLYKEAFVPMTPEAAQAAAGGMPPPPVPPMAPAMMGGMPPPVPPIDPAMMGGMPPPVPPMDPAMMGGMSPSLPAEGTEANLNTPVTVTLADLKALLKEDGVSGGARRVSNSELLDKLTSIEQLLAILITGSPEAAQQLLAVPADIQATQATQATQASQSKQAAKSSSDTISKLVARLRRIS